MAEEVAAQDYDLTVRVQRLERRFRIQNWTITVMLAVLNLILLVR